MSTTPVRNWAGNVTYGATRLHRPRSLDELRALVAGADRIRAVGSGHSFNGVADTTGELVSLDRLPATFEVDRDAGAVTVAAGMTYGEVVVALHDAGLALGTLASLPHISVAGSCATGTHGSGDTERCLAAAVRALRLVGPDGDVVDLDGDTLPGAVVALGGLGVVTHLTLGVEPAYDMRQSVRLGVPLGKVAGAVDEVFGAGHSVSVFTDWRSGTGSVFLKQRVDREASGWAGGRPAAELVHPVPGMSTDSSTAQLDVVGPWFERLPHFRADRLPSSAGNELQSELYLPRSQAPAAFAALRELGELMAPVLQVAEVRTVAADDLWLSPAHHRDSVTIHFTWVLDPAAVLPVIAAVERRLHPLGARPHWGKLTTLPPAEVTAAYDRAADFTRLRSTLDPTGKFTNALLDAHFPPR
ncbi:FAD-binding protein [Actinokineospora spheciospongiae]|uniref:FAD-binding protein n=1 Tax=Actinokineospora spheciospongiae TaxID=909613 RepID=UPI000D70BF03|nr:FAD-binding protein [Actinokineospora spheciospongiae]PWW66790.1 xylitol oxidase [Actinokineospora spheciospongiae]